MIAPIHDLFETHLTVADLQRSMDLYDGALVRYAARNQNFALVVFGSPVNSAGCRSFWLLSPDFCLPYPARDIKGAALG